MNAPVLLIDAGNTRIKWALGAGAAPHVAGQTWLASGSFAHDAAPDEWVQLPRPRGAWISNVAGATIEERLAAWLDAHWPQLPRTVVRACATQCGVANGYLAPTQLGSDRWSGLIGARASFPGEAVLIATLGTATTLEALRSDGRFEGGLIAPGWELMMRSLGTQTAQLPLLDGNHAASLLGRADVPLALDTPHALGLGGLYAQAGLIERAWRDLGSAWGEPVRLVVTGGNADVLAKWLRVPYTQHASLVLEGLACIAAAG